MTTKSEESIYLQKVTMIDLDTGWIEIRVVPSARANLVSNQVELAWLTHYPLPSKVAKFREIIINDYDIKVKPITSRNPLGNATLERVHQTIDNILRTFKIQSMMLDDKNLRDCILGSTKFSLRAMVYTTTQHTPAQLVFG